MLNVDPVRRNGFVREIFCVLSHDHVTPARPGLGSGIEDDYNLDGNLDTKAHFAERIAVLYGVSAETRCVIWSTVMFEPR